MTSAAPPEASPTTVLRAPAPHEGSVLHDLVVRGGGLDRNSPYAYVLGARFHGGTSVLADAPSGPVGFVLGITPPTRPDTLFVWQVGVMPEARGQGLGLRMLRWLVDEVRPRTLEATVTPSNLASQRLFRALARTYEVPLEVARWADSAELDGAEPEDLHRIGPFPT